MPNVVLLVADDLVPYGLGAHDGGLPITPKIDNLISQGVCFTQAVSNGMMCKPGRTSLLTSLYPHQHGQLNNQFYQPPPGGGPSRYLPQEFKNAGFDTVGFGKWHSRFSPQQAGFDSHQGNEDDTWQNLLSYAETFGQGPNPVFLYVGFHEPHRPWWPKPAALELYDGAQIPLRKNVNHPRVNKPVMQDTLEVTGNAMLVDDGFDPQDPDTTLRYYYAFISTLDFRVGEILKRIKQSGAANDTLFCLTSDQGQMVHNHGITFKGPVIYEEMTRIPMVFAWPGVIPAGVPREEAVEIVDVAPTLLEGAGLSVPQAFRGASIWPALAGQPFAGRDYTISQTYLESPVLGHLRSLRDKKTPGQDQWKIGLYDNDVHELYNLTQDPFELTNLKDDEPVRFQEMRQQLVQWMADHQDSNPAPAP